MLFPHVQKQIEAEQVDGGRRFISMVWFMGLKGEN
jgi:hypothetical protein